MNHNMDDTLANAGETVTKPSKLFQLKGLSHAPFKAEPCEHKAMTIRWRPEPGVYYPLQCTQHEWDMKTSLCMSVPGVRNMYLSILKISVTAVFPKEEMLHMAAWMDSCFCERHRTEGKCMCYMIADAVRRLDEKIESGKFDGTDKGSNKYFNVDVDYTLNDHKAFEIMKVNRDEALLKGKASFSRGKYKIHFPAPISGDFLHMIDRILANKGFEFCRVCPLVTNPTLHEQFTPSRLGRIFHE